MCDFKPGDEVVCVDGRSYRPGGFWLDAPVEGGVYMVRKVGVTAISGSPGVWLHGLRNHTRYAWDDGYRASRFRKVHRRDLTAWLATENTIEEPKRAPAKKRERVS